MECAGCEGGFDFDWCCLMNETRTRTQVMGMMIAMQMSKKAAPMAGHEVFGTKQAVDQVLPGAWIDLFGITRD